MKINEFENVKSEFVFFKSFIYFNYELKEIF